MLDRRILAVFTIFFIEAFSFATWLPRLPELKTGFGLSDGDLGLALLALPAGALVVMPIAGIASTRLTVQRLNLICLSWMYLAIVLIGLAGSAMMFAVVLFLVGMGSGSIGVAMNAAGFAVEQHLKRPILSRCHAMFSTGLACGGLASGVFAAEGVPIFAHLATVNATLFVLLLIAIAGLSSLPPGRGHGASPPRFAFPSGALIVPACIALGCLLAEGAVLDWSAVYLAQVVGAQGALVGAGVSVFAAAMAAVRFCGDWLAVRFSPTALVAGGAGLAACGYVTAALASDAWVALAGFVLIGFGVAPIVPIAFRLGGQMSPDAPGVGVASVSTLGYVGFLAGPALIGLVADATSLRVSFGAVAATLLVVGALSFAIGRAPRAGPRRRPV